MRLGYTRAAWTSQNAIGACRLSRSTVVWLISETDQPAPPKMLCKDLLTNATALQVGVFLADVGKTCYE